MSLAERQARVIWSGELRTGSGELKAGSGSFSVPISFQARLDSDSDVTSPEELIAAAHASSYGMLLANTLHSNGLQPDKLEVTAVCKLARNEDGLTIQEVELQVNFWHDKVDEDTFQDLAQRAEQRCPVSNALRGGVNISLNLTLNPPVKV